MKTNLNLLFASLFLATTSSALATVRYVNVNNAHPRPPYTNWVTAATNIQAAVDAAGAGDEIVVTNGIYAGRSQLDPNGDYRSLLVELPLTLQSVNGPGVTIIDGEEGGGVYLATNTIMVGFTLTNSWAFEGGGICCESTNAVLTHCVLSGNGAGYGGGAFGGTLNNCTLTGNSSEYAGGGAYICTLNNCILTGNSAWEYGGGANSCTLNSCAVSGNTGDGADDSTLNNCTITGNSGWGASSDTLNNCIVYFNSDANGGNYDPFSTLNFCCTTPLPDSGIGNLSADPQLASASHLSAESTCIGAGSSQYVSGIDIDGEAWANPPSIGCEEYHAGAVIGPLTVSLTATYTNVAAGFPVSLTAFIAGRTDLSVWDFGDGSVVSNRPYACHAWTASGDYPVILRAYNDTYPGGVAASVTVHVMAQPAYYVSLSSSAPVSPYSSWATAATNIQDAVDAAGAGGTIFVTNGNYASAQKEKPGLKAFI